VRGCADCGHPEHRSGVCGYAITETFRDDVGYMVRPSGATRVVLVDTCDCEFLCEVP